MIHACIFRLSFGRVTSGEMIDPTTGVWTSTGTDEPSTANAVAPNTTYVLASTNDQTDRCIVAIEGSASIESCEPFKPSSGSDRLDVRRMGIAECRVAVFRISSFAWRNAYEETCRRWAEFITQCLDSSSPTLYREMVIFLPNAISKRRFSLRLSDLYSRRHSQSLSHRDQPEQKSDKSDYV